MTKSETGTPEQPKIAEPKAHVLLLGGTGPLRAADAPMPAGDAENLFSASDYRCSALFCDAGTPSLSGETGSNAIAWLKSAGISLAALSGVSSGELEGTLAALGTVSAIGVGQNQPLANRAEIVSINGVRLGFLCMNECTGDRERYAAEADILEADALNRVRELLPQCDHIVVFCRTGIPGFGLPLPEWRARYRRLIKAGASVVCGMEPDEPNGWEEYGNGLILYGLGTLADDRAGMTSRSLAVLLSFQQNKGFAYGARLLETSSGAIAPCMEEAAKNALNAQNALLLDETAYLAAVEQRCAQYYESGEFELLFCGKARGPIAALLHPKAQENHREEEERLRRLLLSESRQLVVLRALKHKKEHDSTEI